MILSTVVSPLIAVQITRYLDDQNEVRDRKLQVFKTLMATRAQTLSPAHVEALNRIDLEFNFKLKKEKTVLDIWQQYLDHLGDKGIEGLVWQSKRVDLLVDLLHAMADALGYDFNKTQIKNGTYSPIAHGQLEVEQEAFRCMMLELLEGKRVLPMFMTNLPIAQPHQAQGETAI